MIITLITIAASRKLGDEKIAVDSILRIFENLLEPRTRTELRSRCYDLISYSVVTTTRICERLIHWFRIINLSRAAGKRHESAISIEVFAIAYGKHSFNVPFCRSSDARETQDWSLKTVEVPVRKSLNLSAIISDLPENSVLVDNVSVFFKTCFYQRF